MGISVEEDVEALIVGELVGTSTDADGDVLIEVEGIVGAEVGLAVVVTHSTTVCPGLC